VQGTFHLSAASLTAGLSVEIRDNEMAYLFSLHLHTKNALPINIVHGAMHPAGSLARPAAPIAAESFLNSRTNEGASSGNQALRAAYLCNHAPTQVSGTRAGNSACIASYFVLAYMSARSTGRFVVHASGCDQRPSHRRSGVRLKALGHD
jgi:hypothetical protein